MKQEVVNKIKEQRVEAGITQEDLGKAVGVSRQSIIAIEKGQYIPSLPLALKFAKYFNCKMEELFSLTEESNG